MKIVFRNLKKYKIICIIVLLFLLIKLLTISNYKTVWWDSSVYIGMGKHMYSHGDSGLWEGSRPLVWPLMLGFLWKMGFDAVLAGRILEIIFGSLCIFLTYLIAKKIFNTEFNKGTNKSIALLASAFLAFSPTFFFFGGVMLTEVASTFFSLMAVYFLIKGKSFVSGIFFGISFMTRFIQLFALIGAVLAMLFYADKKNIRNRDHMRCKKNIGNLAKLLAGFIIAAIPFLILNQIIYGNLLAPFLIQVFLSKNTGWANYNPISYYFLRLFKDNLLYLLFIPGVFFALRGKGFAKDKSFEDKDFELKNKSHKASAAIIAIIAILFFVFFNLIKQKEMRFLIVLLPYLYMLIAYSIMGILHNANNKLIKHSMSALIFSSFIFSIINLHHYYGSESSKTNQYEYLQDKFRELDANGVIWASNPVMAVESDKKIAELMYYPVFNKEKKEKLKEYLFKWGSTPDFVFVDSCDLECKPNDEVCGFDRDELLNMLKQKLKILHSSKINNCEQLILEK